MKRLIYHLPRNVLLAVLAGFILSGCVQQPPAPTSVPTQPAAAPTKAPVIPPTAPAVPTKAPAIPPTAPAAQVATPAPQPTATQAKVQPKRGGTLIISLGTDIPIFDSAKATGIPNLGIILLVSETLTRIAPEGGAVLPNLAESWKQSEDGSYWTLNLRKGVKFHDGTPFNAEAVKFNVERLFDPATKAAAAGAFSMIKKVEVVDEYTVKMITGDPFAPLMATLAYAPMGINSPTQVKKLGNDNYYTAPMGTGPFKFVYHKKGEEARLEANKDYWGGAPYLDAVVMKPIPETAARVMALESGQVHAIYHVPPRDAERLKTDKRFEVLTPNQQRAILVGFNVTKKPLDDPKVRQALNYAVDKKAINDRIFLGIPKIADSPVPQTVWGYVKTKDYTYDPEKAKQLLKDAGYPNGFEVTLHASPGRYLMDAEVIEAVQSYLQKVNVKVNIITLEWAAYQTAQRKKVEESQIQMFFIGWGVPTLDADIIIKNYLKEGWGELGLNTMYYTNPEVEKLVLAQRTAKDDKSRLDALKKAQEIIMEDAPQIFLYTEPQIHAKSTKVQNLIISVTEMVDQMHLTWLSD
jgi:peptide/nickel transport system substrate-binding protein